MTIGWNYTNAFIWINKSREKKNGNTKVALWNWLNQNKFTVPVPDEVKSKGLLRDRFQCTQLVATNIVHFLFTDYYEFNHDKNDDIFFCWFTFFLMRKKNLYKFFSTTQLLLTLQLFNIDSLYDVDCVFVCRWVIFIFHSHQYNRLYRFDWRTNVIYLCTHEV